jgi:hypothetical protein
MQQYQASFGDVVRIDGNKDVDQVHAAVLAALGLES